MLECFRFHVSLTVEPIHHEGRTWRLCPGMEHQAHSTMKAHESSLAFLHHLTDFQNLLKSHAENHNKVR